MVPVRRQQNVTTVRVRNNNGYTYGQATMQDGQPARMDSLGQTSMLWEKKRANMDKIEAFREQRLQHQI